MTTSMTLASFIDHLERWGSDLDSWPPADATSGRVLVAANAAAAQALAEARSLEQMLEAIPPAPAPAGLRNRILVAAQPTPRVGAIERLLGWLQAALWRPLAASAMALALGFIVGAMQPQPEAELYAEELALLAISDFEDLPYEN